MARLGLSRMPALAESGRARTPAIDPTAIETGIVHLGLGAFHRAHQAWYTEDAMTASGDLGWGIRAVDPLAAALPDALSEQDCLYTVLERGPGAGPPRVMAPIREAVTSMDDSVDVPGMIADPDVRVVTLTVTEKGYRRDGAGRLDLNDPVTRADLAGAPPRSALGLLVAGLRRRRDTSGRPVTVLCCDNLTSNGTQLKRLVGEFCGQLSGDADPTEWIASSVTFPSSMIDRIVPATTDADRDEVAGLLGLRDEAAVVCEPFIQWVIEDEFVAGRPAWDSVGALMTDDVTPYENAKLRLLNGTHSTLAYTGALSGYETIAEAVADPALASLAAALMREDSAPTLEPPAGLDLGEYQAQLLERFANPALRHTTIQIAMDGSQKLPIRLLGTMRDRLAAGAEPRWAARGVAAWLLFVAYGRSRDGRELPLNDPLAARLKTALVPAAGSPKALVEAGLGIREVFGDDLPADGAFRALLVDAVDQVRADLRLPSP